MPKPTTKLAAAVAVCVLGSITLAAAQEKPQNEAPAAGAAPTATADECHAAPKGTAPQGSHWYYRTDRAMKRKCWYLADEVAKANKTASSKPSPAAETPAPRADKPMRPAVANARAELATHTDDEQAKLAETTWPAIAETAAVETSPRDAAPNTSAADGQPRQFATRWPEPATAANSADLQTKLASSQVANEQTGAQQQIAAPVAVAPQPATAKPSSEPSHFLGLLLSVVAGVLALLAIVGPMLLRYVRSQQRDQPQTSERRRAIWDNIDQGEQSIFTPIAEPALQHSLTRKRRNLDEPPRENDPSREIEELLSRVSKRSAA